MLREARGCDLRRAATWTGSESVVFWFRTPFRARGLRKLKSYIELSQRVAEPAPAAWLPMTALDASQRFQRNPEDHTDEFREALEFALNSLSRRRADKKQLTKAALTGGLCLFR